MKEMKASMDVIRKTAGEMIAQLTDRSISQSYLFRLGVWFQW